MQVRQTQIYAKWFDRLKDRSARAKINIRIRRLSLGNSGDSKSVGGGVRELRIDFGPGYRVYYWQKGDELILLLAGGDKSSQPSDIHTARQLLADLTENPDA